MEGPSECSSVYFRLPYSLERLKDEQRERERKQEKLKEII